MCDNNKSCGDESGLCKDKNCCEKGQNCKNLKEYLNEENCASRYSGPEIFCKYKDAVVQIRSTVQYIPSGGGPEETLTKVGTGFFIKKKYIVTAAHNVMYNNSLGVRVPTPTIVDFNRMNQIFVTVTNVNGSYKNYIYLATLVGVDGAGDIAVLRISQEVEWNRNIPCIGDCHPEFKLGNSRDYCIGRKTYCIGSAPGDQIQFFSEGVNSNNKFFQCSGNDRQVTELVTTTNPGFPDSAGTPIIGEEGKIIGMQTYSIDTTGTPLNAGPSSYFMEFVVNTFIKGPRSSFGGHIEQISDELGNYYRFLKSFLGITWSIYTPSSDPDNEYKKVRGIVINSVNASSSFYNTFNPLLVDDQTILLTNINKCEVGRIDNQINPTVITWTCVPSLDPIRLTYRLSGDNFKQSYNSTSTAVGFPYALDINNASVM